MKNRYGEIMIRTRIVLGIKKPDLIIAWFVTDFIKTMKYLLLLIITIAFLSCQKDKTRDTIKEGNTLKKDTLIVIDETNNALTSIQIVYFITSMNGNLIASKKIEKNCINVLYIPDSIHYDKFNVHKFTYIESENTFSLESVLNTDKKFFNGNDPCSNANPNTYIGKCNFNFKSNLNYDWYSIYCPTGGQDGYALNADASSFLYTDNNYLYTFIKKGNNYFYKYYYNLIPDSTYQILINSDSMKSDVQIDTIAAPSGYNFNSYNWIRAYLSGNYKCYFSGHNIYTKTVENATKLLVVSPPSQFYKYYQSVLNFIKIDNKTYGYSHLGNIPKNIPDFNFNLSIENSKINDISISTTGKYDYLVGEYLADYSYNLNNWKFYTDNTEKIVFPQLPQEVLELVPKLSKETFITGKNSYFNFTLFNIEGINNYKDFIYTYDNYSFIKQYDIYQKINIGELYNKLPPDSRSLQ